MTYTVLFDVHRGQLDEGLAPPDGLAALVSGGLSSAAWGDHGAGLTAEENGQALEFRNAMDGAAGAAAVLIEALGEHWELVRVTIVGHFNPGNKAHAGWNNDFTQVSAAILTYR